MLQFAHPEEPVKLNWPAGQFAHPFTPAYCPPAQRGKLARLAAASDAASSAIFQVTSLEMAKPEYSPQQPPMLIPSAA
jgi:hypothetical protein